MTLDEVGAGLRRFQVVHELIQLRNEHVSVEHGFLLSLQDERLVEQTLLQVRHPALLILGKLLDESFERFSGLGLR